MNITEMHLAVQQGVDKINSFQADTLLSEEIDLELNKAINKFVNLKYGKNNLYTKGFEESQKRVDDLRVLIKDVDLKFSYRDTTVNNIYTYTSSELPSDYRFLLKALAEVSHKSTCKTLNREEQLIAGYLKDNDSRAIHRKSSMKFVQQDDILTILSDPFNTTTKEKPLITIEHDSIIVYTSDIFIIENVKLTYIKNPAKVSLSLGVDCELAEQTHQEIVDMCVNSILEGISDPRYKTQSIELGKNE
tara:strand:+ start:37 stop:777 length:741 start_codon:yes stop_codon:yes gene_type:complete